MTCSDGCGRKVWARGLCSSHYTARYQSGRLEGAPRIRRQRGEGSVTSVGYVLKTEGGKQRAEHIHLVERLLGKPIPDGVEIHHFNENKADNRPQNLVVCPNHAYHALLHVRQAALEACGHADWRRCTFCKEYDSPINLTFGSAGPGVSPKIYHTACRSAARRAQYAAKRQMEAIIQ